MLPLGARPDRDGNGALDWRVRVFALGHTAIAVEPPDTESDQHDPGDMPLFHKEARDVELALDNLIVALTVCHDYLARRQSGLRPRPPSPRPLICNQGIISTTSPSLTSVTPVVMTRSPSFTPSVTAIELPYVSSSFTSPSFQTLS